MKEMHKWKDKVEVTLDNRQIFFLFFGASVVGCFVFGLGMMAGRRIDFDLRGEGSATAQDSLAMLQTEAEELEGPFAFQEALRPEPVVAPRPAPEPEAAPEPVVPPVAAIVAAPEPAPEPVPPPKAKPRAAAPQPDRKPAATPAPRAATATLAAAQTAKPATPAAPAVAPSGRNFTLQMKAFSKQDEADAFAAQLRARGHDVRVESHEIKGRVWYRVRVGSFASWEDGLSAKEAFEQKEKIIAYVVRQ